MRKLPMLFLLAGLTACSGQGSGPTDALVNGPKPDFSINISGGTSPTITWTGAKGFELNFTVDQSDMSKVSVSQISPWSFVTFSGFASPLKYGSLPAGSSCDLIGSLCNAQGLIKGVTYDVTLQLVDGKLSWTTYKY
jgi:hypothetical protein